MTPLTVSFLDGEGAAASYLVGLVRDSGRPEVETGEANESWKGPHHVSKNVRERVVAVRGVAECGYVGDRADRGPAQCCQARVVLKHLGKKSSYLPVVPVEHSILIVPHHVPGLLSADGIDAETHPVGHGPGDSEKTLARTAVG